MKTMRQKKLRFFRALSLTVFVVYYGRICTDLYIEKLNKISKYAHVRWDWNVQTLCEKGILHSILSLKIRNLNNFGEKIQVCKNSFVLLYMWKK